MLPMVISACVHVTCASGTREITDSISNHYSVADTMDGHPNKRQKQYGPIYQKDWERLFSGVIDPSKQGDLRHVTFCASGAYDCMNI